MIDQLLRQLIAQEIPITLQLCQVDSVSEDQWSCDCTPLDGAAPFLDVRIAASGSGHSIRIVPLIGSLALIGEANGTAFLLKATEFNQVLITDKNGFNLELTEDGLSIEAAQVTLNNGQHGGLVVASRLVTEIAKNNQLLETIKNIFTNWVPVPQDGGAALKAVMVPALSPLPTADLSNIENEKVKH